MLHTCTTEYYSGIKKEGNLAISDNILDPWMDLEGILLSEMSEKDKYYMISLIHEIWKKQAYRYREQIGGGLK